MIPVTTLTVFPTMFPCNFTKTDFTCFCPAKLVLLVQGPLGTQGVPEGRPQAHQGDSQGVPKGSSRIPRIPKGFPRDPPGVVFRYLLDIKNDLSGEPPSAKDHPWKKKGGGMREAFRSAAPRRGVGRVLDFFNIYAEFFSFRCHRACRRPAPVKHPRSPTF